MTNIVDRQGNPLTIGDWVIFFPDIVELVKKHKENKFTSEDLDLFKVQQIKQISPANRIGIISSINDWYVPTKHIQKLPKGDWEHQELVLFLRLCGVDITDPDEPENNDGD